MINGTDTAAAKVKDSKSVDDYADDTSSFSKIRPTRAGREGVLTRRMED